VPRIRKDQQEGNEEEEDADTEPPQWRSFCVKRREADDEKTHGFIPVTTQVLPAAVCDEEQQFEHVAEPRAADPVFGPSLRPLALRTSCV